MTDTRNRSVKRRALAAALCLVLFFFIPGPRESVPAGNKWYAFCEPRSGEVTYGEHLITGRKLMAGPFQGPREAYDWINGNCPRWRCNAGGACATAPAPGQGGEWKVFCGRNDLVVYLGKTYDSTKHILIRESFLGEPDARAWVNQYYPGWLCTPTGAAASGPRTGGNWTVVCSRKHGGVSLTQYPNRIDYHVWGEGFLGEPDARAWTNRNCPSWRCDSEGRCLIGAVQRMPEGRPLEVLPDGPSTGSPPGPGTAAVPPPVVKPPGTPPTGTTGPAPVKREGDEWVVWYAPKIGWAPVFITPQKTFEKQEASCRYPGGGIDCKVILEKTFLLGPYPDHGSAKKAICSQMSNFGTLRGIYDGMRVAEFQGRRHNIDTIGGCGTIPPPPETKPGGQGVDSKALRDEYFKKCTAMREPYVKRNCTPAPGYSGCALDPQGCANYIIVNALPDGKSQGRVGCGRGVVDSYISCLRDCNERLVARKLNVFSIGPCGTACRDKADTATKACNAANR